MKLNRTVMTVIFLFISLIFLNINLVYSDVYVDGSSQANPFYVETVEQQTTTGAGISTTQESVPTSQTSASRTSSSSNDINANFFLENSLMSIDKHSSPNYKDYYLANKSYTVEVEMNGVSRSLDNILIKETIDPSLDVSFSKFKAYIVDPFDASSTRYIKLADNMRLDKMKENYTVDYKNNTIYILKFLG
jgi:hypothetical protein